MTAPEAADPPGDGAGLTPPSPRARSSVPPRIVRRLVLAPTFVVGAIALSVSLPVWVIIAAFVSRFVPGRWRILRVAWFLFVYVWWETIALIALFLMWIACGFGWRLRSESWQRRHYAFAAWWLDRVMNSARRTFRLKIEQSVDDQVERSPNPVLVFSRHAGPGDSFLLVDAVLNTAHRRPRIVLKDLLQLDPVVGDDVEHG